MVNIEQSRSTDGSEAFSLEYHRNIPRASLYKDIESYLGEYRFSIPRYGYDLLYKADQSGTYRIVDLHDGEPMTIKTYRAVKKREDVWKNTDRERAEYEGMCALERQLESAPDGATILWTSPPGPPEDGYGDYGFFYVGKAHKNGTNTHLAMTAIRIDHQTVVQCREAIAQLTGQPVDFQSAEACIAQPAVVPPVNTIDLQRVLKDIFNFTPDFENEQIFKVMMTVLKPHIHSFIDLIHQGESEDIIQKAFYALENYAIKLRTIVQEDFKRQIPMAAIFFSYQSAITLPWLMTHFGQHAPPVIAGSCGSTGSRNGLKSNNIFNNSLSSLTDLFSSESSENFICPRCHKESTLPVGDQCPKCNFTKEEAKQQGMITC